MLMSNDFKCAGDFGLSKKEFRRHCHRTAEATEKLTLFHMRRFLMFQLVYQPLVAQETKKRKDSEKFMLVPELRRSLRRKLVLASSNSAASG